MKLRLMVFCTAQCTVFSCATLATDSMKGELSDALQDTAYYQILISLCLAFDKRQKIVEVSENLIIDYYRRELKKLLL